MQGGGIVSDIEVSKSDLATSGSTSESGSESDSYRSASSSCESWDVVDVDFRGTGAFLFLRAFASEADSEEVTGSTAALSDAVLVCSFLFMVLAFNDSILKSESLSSEAECSWLRVSVYSDLTL